jgi:hypothetical protein
MAQNPQAQQLPPEQHEDMVAQIQGQLIAQFQQQNPASQQGDDDPLVAIKKQELDLRAKTKQQTNKSIKKSCV